MGDSAEQITPDTRHTVWLQSIVVGSRPLGKAGTPRDQFVDGELPEPARV